MIYVGLVLNGPEPLPSELDRAIREMRRQFAEVETGNASLDLVLVVGGSFGDAPFAGIRIGRLSKARRLLQVQVGFPRTAVKLGAAPTLLHQLVKQALAEARSVFDSRGIAFDPRPATDLLSPEPIGRMELVEFLMSEPQIEVHVLHSGEDDGIVDTISVEDVLIGALENEGIGEVVGHESGRRDSTIFVRGDHPRLLEAIMEALEKTRLPLESFRVSRISRPD